MRQKVTKKGRTKDKGLKGRKAQIIQQEEKKIQAKREKAKGERKKIK